MDNLPKFTTVEWSRIVFSSFGRVADVFIPMSGRKGKGKCFDFVWFGDRRFTIKAVGAMNGSRYYGRRLTMNIAKYVWTNRKKGWEG